MSTASTVNQEDRRTASHWVGLLKSNGALLALLVLLLLNLLFTPNFAAVNTMWNVLIQVSSIALVAVGMTMVIATGGIDLSVGSVMAMASVAAAKFLDFGAVTAILLALAVVTLVGALQGVIMTTFRIQPIIVTMCLLISGRGIAQVVTDGYLINFTHPQFSWVGQGKIGPVPVQVLLMFLVVALAAYFMRISTFGRYVLAAGGNPRAARLAGVNVLLVTAGVYAISALLSGMAGVIETARLSAAAGDHHQLQHEQRALRLLPGA